MRPLTLALLFLLGCAPESDDELALDDSQQALTNAGPSLADGTRTTIASVTGAENQLFTSTGRLFVTGDKGIFELKKNGAGFALITRIGAQSCQFGGIAEANGFLYANCYGLTDSNLYAAALVEAPSFSNIGALGRGLANGLTADAQGRLYVTSTLSDQILRLTPAANGKSIASRDVFQNRAGSLANGIDHYGGNLYWTDSVTIKRNSVASPTTNPKVLVTAFSYFDDLQVDASGILVTDFTAGVLRAYDLNGRPTGVSRNVFNGPSSVERALGRAGLGANTLVITERNGNRVSLYEPR